MLFYAELLPNGEKRVLTFALHTVNGQPKVQSFKLGERLPRDLKLIPFPCMDVNGDRNKSMRKFYRKALLQGLHIYNGPEIDGKANVNGVYYQARCSEAFERKCPLDTDLNNRNTLISQGIITVVDISIDALVQMDTNIRLSLDEKRALTAMDQKLKELTPAHLIPSEWLDLLKNPRATEDDVYRMLLKVATDTNNAGNYTVPSWWFGQLNKRQEMGDFFSRILNFAREFSRAHQAEQAALSTDAGNVPAGERKEHAEAAAAAATAGPAASDQTTRTASALAAAAAAASQAAPASDHTVTLEMGGGAPQRPIATAFQQMQAAQAAMPAAAAAEAAAPRQEQGRRALSPKANGSSTPDQA